MIKTGFLTETNKINIFFKIIYSALITYIFLVPFYYMPYFAFRGLKLPLIKYLPLLMILALLYLSLRKKNLSWAVLFKDRINVLIVVSFVFTLCSGLFTFYYYVSVMKALYYGLTGVLVYFIFFTSNLNKADIEYILKVFVIISFISAAYGIVCFLLGKDPLFLNCATLDNIALRRTIICPLHDIHLKAGRISSTIGNPHFLGTFLSFTFPLSVYFWLISTRKKSLLFQFSSAVIFIAILLTFSTGAYITVAVTLIYMFVYAKRFLGSDNYGSVKRIAFLLLFLLASILFLRIIGFALSYYGIIPLKNMGRIDIISILSLDRFDQRLDSLRLLFSNFFTNHGFGIGIGIISRGLSSLYRYNLDNFYCTALIEFGLIPAFMLFFMFFYFSRQVINSISSNTKNSLLNIILLISWSSFFINMLFWDVYYHPALRIALWSIMAIISKTRAECA